MVVLVVVAGLAAAGVGPGGPHRFVVLHRRRLWNAGWNSTAYSSSSILKRLPSRPSVVISESGRFDCI